MKLIQIFGMGCARCHETENNVREAAARLGLDAQIEFVGDLKKMTAMGIIGTPAVAVDGKVVLAGSVPSAAACAALLEKYR
ncbi:MULTISPECIES: thioredoxin family protein [unclassified Pyramidobacter]|uniref:thioredoxin family protein n=1 Tax=unclassified Pyramidobacter TaxID=2632171 RepID=UPI000EA0A4A0|nr:thioredoxin family protein [Pyramidobacter sp. CG50-2]RKJ75859.1 thioredoxin family protein [Pyramidobacter sp. CG50-2]